MGGAIEATRRPAPDKLGVVDGGRTQATPVAASR